MQPPSLCALTQPKERRVCGFQVALSLTSTKAEKLRWTFVTHFLLLPDGLLWPLFNARHFTFKAPSPLQALEKEYGYSVAKSYDHLPRWRLGCNKGHRLSLVTQSAWPEDWAMHSAQLTRNAHSCPVIGDKSTWLLLLASPG